VFGIPEGKVAQSIYQTGRAVIRCHTLMFSNDFRDKLDNHLVANGDCLVIATSLSLSTWLASRSATPMRVGCRGCGARE